MHMRMFHTRVHAEQVNCTLTCMVHLASSGNLKLRGMQAVVNRGLNMLCARAVSLLSGLKKKNNQKERQKKRDKERRKEE